MNVNWTKFKLGFVGVMVWLVLGACVGWRDMRHEKTARGVGILHARHAEEGMDCTDCHEFMAQATTPTMPTHDICSMCHEFDVESPTKESCGLCHDRRDFSVDPYRARLSSEQIFDHATHAEAEVACTQCHGDKTEPRPMRSPLMPECVKCHSETGSPKLLECATCHKEIRMDLIPEFRDGTRIAHDSPTVWTQVHGREARMNSNFCARCHEDEQAFCADCHRLEKPASHNVSWNRRTHGVHAAWDRDTCSVCHQEDSCMRCHERTQPTSHRGSFTPPSSTHCVQCHFPAETNCAICHQAIDHRTAGPTPHGPFTGTCSDCHPVGMPGIAPHTVNPVINCTVCHQ